MTPWDENGLDSTTFKVQNGRKDIIKVIHVTPVKLETPIL